MSLQQYKYKIYAHQIMCVLLSSCSKVIFITKNLLDIYVPIVLVA